jgi:hypothetical protein
MSRLKRIGDLEIAEDIELERRTWTVEHIAWVAMVLILLAALAGIFGNGPLSWASASSSDSNLVIEYQRFVRNQARSDLRIRIFPEAVEADRGARIWISREYLERSKIASIAPEPEHVESTPDGMIFTFLVPKQENDSVIHLRLDIETIGRIRGRVGLVRGAATQPQPNQIVAMSQFAYP